MRKIILICTSFIMLAFPSTAEKSKKRIPLFRLLDISGNAVFGIPVKSIAEKKEDFTVFRDSSAGGKNADAGYGCTSFSEAAGMCTLSGGGGFRILLRGIDLRFYRRMNKTAFSAFPPGGSFIYGTEIDMQRICSFPLRAAAGKITQSGILSLITSPEPSYSAQPFASAVSGLSRLSYSLPSASSADKPEAYSVSLDLPPFSKISLETSFQGAYREDGREAGSILCSFKPSEQCSAGFSFSAGRFYLENKSSSSWFASEKQFSSNWFPAFTGQSQFFSPYFTMRCTGNCYFQPYDRPRFTVCAESTVHLKNMLINADFFTSDGSGIICPDSSILTVIREIRVNPQYTFRFAGKNKKQIRAGTAFCIRTQADAENSWNSTHLKAGISAEYSDRTISVRTSAGGTGFIISQSGNAPSESESYTGAVSFRKIRKNTAAAFSGNFTITPESASGSASSNEKFSAGITHTAKIKTGGTLSCAFSQKNGTFSGCRTAAGFSFQTEQKKVRVTGKISAEVSF